MSQLRIIRQTALSTEKFTKDGNPKTVNVILKDKPFLIDLGLTKSAGNKDFDLKTAVLEANLLYDSPEREVAWIQVQPFEYTAKVNSDGSSATLECFIHILSSQNENALFRVRLRARAPNNKKVDYLEVSTDPIQVISKPSVLRKKQEREKQKHNELTAKSGVVPVKSKSIVSVASSSTTGATKRVREKDDLILEALSQIQQQQSDQQKLLEALTSNVPRSPNVQFSGVTPALNFHASPMENEDEFEYSFRLFLHCFNNTDRSDRPGKIRKILRDNAPSQVAPLVETLWSEYSNNSPRETPDAVPTSLAMQLEPQQWKLESSDFTWKSHSMGSELTVSKRDNEVNELLNDVLSSVDQASSTLQQKADLSTETTAQTLQPAN